MSILTDYQKAALEYNKHISLTANAGSGKTTVLSKRYVEILLNEKTSINNIVAITFTEKAASELYSKIASEIDGRIDASSTRESYKLESIRRSLVSAKISTIHSFCIDILKDYAPEAGIDANFSPIDARTSDDLLSQSIEEAINSNLMMDSKTVKNLIRVFSNRSQLIKKLKQLFHKRKSTEKLITNLYNKEIVEIGDQFQNNFTEKFELLFKEDLREIEQNIAKINSIAESYKQTEKQIEINRLINELNAQSTLLEKYFIINEIKTQILTSSGSIAKRGYLSTTLYEDNADIIEDTAELFNRLKDIEIEKDYEQLNNILAEFGKELTSFYNEINERYTNKKQLKSYLDFEDLLLVTQDLLTNEEVKNALSEKYKYIMIDEYQDTNETQYNIFMPILKNLTSGNLFVVGDEKQSIYMFREAEVELFNQTKREIKSKEDEKSILDLPHSFRLAPNIALFTNILFKKLFKDPKTIFNEVEYNNLVCAYTHEEKGNIEFLLTSDEKITEAEFVARKILKLVNNPDNDYNFDDITILCTKRKNFTELEKVCSDNNIPFTIVGGKGFFQQQLIYDIFNYLSFLINPINDLALASILRSPYYELSDVEITKIVLSDGKNLFSKLKNFSEFNSIVKKLEEHIYSSKTLRPNELIRKINSETGYWAYIAGKSNSSQEIANLEKLIQKAIYINEQGFHSLYDFVSFLNDAINDLEDEGQADLDAGKNAIKIMTIHQSKGLEFKVVILFKTNQKSFDEKLKSKEIVVDKNFGILSKLPVGNNYFEDYKQAPIIGIYNYIQKKKANAELKRLLYVAITRAEQHLIVSAELRKDKFWNGSFAEMIYSAFGSHVDKTEITLNDNLTFMKLVDGSYILNDEFLQLNIPIENFVDKSESIFSEATENLKENLNINVDKVLSTEKNEIISASKISLFLNCPRKYELTYEFGYGELTKLFKEEIDLEFTSKEEELSIPGNTIGSVAHSILEKNIDYKNIKKEISNLLKKEESILLLNTSQREKLNFEIVEIIEKFYKSDTFLYLNKFDKSYNEIEFYKRESDYYLYGIVDKLVINNDKIIVVDYKSDKINKNNIDDKKETYTNQLMFYSYILSNRFPNIVEFELRLVFLRDDKFSVSKIVNKTEVELFGETIKSAIEKIRKRDFSEQTKGCKDMKYYLLD